MSTDVERLVVAMEARTVAFEKALNRANSQAAKQSMRIENRFRAMNKNIEDVFSRGGISQSLQKDMNNSVAAVAAAEGKIGQSAAAMRASLGGLAGLFAARELVNMADTWSDVSARVGIAVGEMSEAPAVMERIYDLAQSTYSGLQQTAESFIANSTALKELGYNTNEQLNYTEALNNALVVSGAKTDRAASVSNALSKAMAAGKLSGDQLNTVIETGGRVAEVLAAELGIGVNQLRDIGAQGKITSQVIYNALTRRMQELSDQAESMPATMGDAFQMIQNAALKSVGALDQTGKVSEKLSGLLGGLANNMDAVAVAGVSMAAVFGARQIGGAANNLGGYVKSTQAAMAAARVAAIQEQAMAAARLRSAEAAFAAARANGLVTASYRNLSRELLAARISLSAANSQLAATGPIATTSAAAVRGFTVAINALGGPVGVGLLALTGIMFAISARSQEAEERANRYSEAIKKAGEDTEYAGLGIEKTAEKLFTLAQGLTEAQKAVRLDTATENVRKSLQELEELIAVTGSSWSSNSRKMAAEAQKVFEKFRDGRIPVEEFNSELDRLSKIDPSVASIIAKMQEIANQASASRGEVNALNIALTGLAGYASTTAKTSRTPPLTDMDFESRFSGFEDVTKNLEAQANAIARAEKKAAGSTSKGRKGKSQRPDELQREIEQIKERTAAIEAETTAQAGINPLIDDYDYAITKARAAQELLNAAKKAGIEITPALKGQIDGLAEGYAQATVQANQLAETQDHMREASDFFKGSMMDAFQSTIPVIETGNKALDKFLNTLIEVALQAALLGKGPLAGIFGGGGGLFSIFPFAKGGVAAHGRPQPMKTFARGGVSRTAAVFGEAGPEAAVPLPDGRRIPVDLRMNGRQAGGTDVVKVVLQDDSGRMAHIADQRIQTAAGPLVEISVRKSMATVSNALPSMMADAQARKM